MVQASPFVALLLLLLLCSDGGINAVGISAPHTRNVIIRVSRGGYSVRWAIYRYVDTKITDDISGGRLPRKDDKWS